MNIPEEDVSLFYKLYHSLLIYVSKNFNSTAVDSRGELMELSLEKLEELRSTLCAHPGVIQQFCAENPCRFSSDELEIIKGWNHFVVGKFVILASRKEYTLFLDLKVPHKLYGVLALLSSFEEMVGPLPTVCETMLLPFKGTIIYDSVLRSHHLPLDADIRQRLNNLYQMALFRCGVITDLPFSEEEKSDEDMLTFFLKDENTKTMYWEDMKALIEKNPVLLRLFHQRMGKMHARIVVKTLQRIGLTKGWFAILEETLIASGATKTEVEKIVKSIVPAKKREFVYYFQLK